MKKRFVDTDRWGDKWFRKLSPSAKLLWGWICDHCDQAGVIDPDLELASFQIGMDVDEKTLEELGTRIGEWQGKVIVPQFIAFQYGSLSESCKPHKPVFAALERHGLTLERLSKGFDRVSNAYPKGINTLEEKEKVKEQVKVIPKKAAKAKGTLEELQAYAVELGQPASDGEAMFDHWESNGWKNGSNPVKCWKAGIRKWRSQGWLPSQKGQTPTGRDYSRIKDGTKIDGGIVIDGKLKTPRRA